jgi:pimeloyl-ACP methyl ester carboxylesterase
VAGALGQPDSPSPTPTVVLVHGLWMRGPELTLLRLRLRRFGYRVVLFRYPSTRRTVAEQGHQLGLFLEMLVASSGIHGPVHVVGHSLGGLVSLAMLQHAIGKSAGYGLVGRVVLLGSPVGGSRVARQFATWGGWARTLLGQSYPAGLDGQFPSGAMPSTAVGVIAGTLRWGIAWLFPGLSVPNDGLVAVGETRLESAADTLCCRVSHLGLVLSSRVAYQVHHFLRDGCFHHGCFQIP